MIISSISKKQEVIASMHVNPSPSGASFLVRMWKDPQREHWHGQVEHIQSGEKISFAHPEKIPEICQTLIKKEVE